jgi:NMD protein affecting ribosome stability and mRNA decay
LLQEFHPFGTHADRAPYYGERKKMLSKRQPIKIHEHAAKRVHVLLQRAGVPYEVEQQVCSDCSRILDEKPLRRATA